MEKVNEGKGEEYISECEIGVEQLLPTNRLKDGEEQTEEKAKPRKPKCLLYFIFTYFHLPHYDESTANQNKPGAYFIDGWDDKLRKFLKYPYN